MLKRSDQVKLLARYSGYKNWTYSPGQTGRVIGLYDGHAAVNLDGYEAERLQAEQFRAKYGESPNEVVFIAEIPTKFLRKLSSQEMQGE